MTNDEGNNASLKYAAMAFLHVAELYPVPPERAAEALYHAGDALSRIKENDARKAQNFRKLAKKVLEQCRSKHRGTPWASKALRLLRRF